MAPTTRKLRVAACFFSVPDSGFPLWMVAVIVILVYGHHHARCIDDWLPRIQRFPNKPVIPEDAQHKRGYVRSIKPTCKREVIDPFGGASPAQAQCDTSQFRLPFMALERQRFCNPRIPAAANHQKFPAHRADTLDRTTQVLPQDNVAID